MYRYEMSVFCENEILILNGKVKKKLFKVLIKPIRHPIFDFCVDENKW